jgi:hypothetical protein
LRAFVRAAPIIQQIHKEGNLFQYLILAAGKAPDSFACRYGCGIME